MQWLNNIVDDLIARQPDGEILIESGASPSGTYHLGHMRELLTPDALLLELRRRGREARHIHFVDDLDALRKVPFNVDAGYEKYLGMPLCDIPAPDGSNRSYADYFLDGFKRAGDMLGIEVTYIYAHEKYRSGEVVPAIERSLERIPEARTALETVSGRKLDEAWSPIQVMEQGRLKNRRFVSLDKDTRELQYIDATGEQKTVRYDDGQVKLDWRLDWPGRWWLLNVVAEPFGRDHASAGGSYETGVQIMKDVYEAEAPYPIPYDFINMAGDTKKMSASKGTGLDAMEGAEIMPAEVVRYFILGAPPSKRLYFDPIGGVMKLMDEYAALAAKPDKTEAEEQLLYICTRGEVDRKVSRIPFSHLVASYQAALRDPSKTIQIIERTEYKDVAVEDAEIITKELQFIDVWLDKHAPEQAKFQLRDHVDASDFSDTEIALFGDLADKVAAAPPDADGEYFHLALYDLKDTYAMSPQEIFAALYRLLIAKTSGPRAGWFLSILPRDWLIDRLRLYR